MIIVVHSENPREVWAALACFAACGWTCDGNRGFCPECSKKEDRNG